MAARRLCGRGDIWRPLAEKGDADAEFNLGQAYRLGRGVPTNLAAAKTWFERAAGQRHVDAETTLGLLLFQNGDQAAGLKWLKKAAEQGEPRALLVYGTALFNGDGVAQDPVLGYAFVSRAAAQGLQPAKETLAQLDKCCRSTTGARAPRSRGSLTKGAPPPTSAAAKPGRKAARTGARSLLRSRSLRRWPPRQLHRRQPLPLAALGESSSAPSRSARTAEALFRKLSGKDALAGRKPVYISAGAVTRLQVGPFESKAAANRHATRSESPASPSSRSSQGPD